MACTQNLSDETQSLGQGAGAGRIASGVRAESTYACNGQNVDSVKVMLQRNGSANSNTIYCRVYNSADVLKCTVGSIVQSSLQDGVLEEITFDSPDTTYALTNQDRIIIQYDYGGSGISYRKYNSAVTGLNFCVEETGGGFSFDSGKCAYIILNDSTPVSSGTRLPPPPIVLGGL
jgi:hypothetical protein